MRDGVAFIYKNKREILVMNNCEVYKRLERDIFSYYVHMIEG